MKRRIKSIICIVVLSLLFVFQGQAAEPIVENGIFQVGEGEAQIVITGNDNQTLVGKSFTIYELLHAENSEGLESINYTVNPVFQEVLRDVVKKRLEKDAVTEFEVIDYMQALQSEGVNSEYRYFVEELREEVVKKGVEGETLAVTSEKDDGSIVITGLEYGYYIIDEKTQVQGMHSAASLCMVTTANPEASLHIKSDYPTMTQKIKEKDDWGVAADLEIGQMAMYKCESNVPDISGYKNYYYTWHGKLEDSLTLDQDSVRVMISDYVMQEDEYEISYTGQEFTVEIKDMKAIVDREFGNVYGQPVVLTYEALLNQNAGLDTGRPGYGSHVRLEFSNDADGDNKESTGFTPWTTTTCFTYQLQAKKINNQGKELANAKFRIYRDKDCTKEVFGEELVSDRNGDFTIVGLDSETYYLKEVVAPSGYRILKKPIQIDISFTMDMQTLQSLKATAYIEGAAEELNTDEEEGEVNLMVINTIGNKLPVTGSKMMLIFAFAAVLLLLLQMKKERKAR